MLWLKWILTFGIVLGGLIGLNLALRAQRNWRRSGGATLPSGEPQLRAAAGLSARLFTDKSLSSGFQPGGGTRGKADLVMSGQRLVLATGHGRVLEIRPDLPGQVRFAGPRRLVVEGLHPSGRARVRAELVVDDAEGWAEAARSVGAVA